MAPASALHTVRWANALADRGHAVQLVSAHRAHPTLDPRVELAPLPVPPPAAYLFNVRSARRWLRQFRPDLVNAHYASGYGTLARRVAFAPWALSVWGSDVYEFPDRSPWHRHLLRRNLRAANRVFSTSEAMARRTRWLEPALQAPVITPFGVDTGRFRPSGHRRSGVDGRVVVGAVKALAPTYGIDRLIRSFAGVFHRMQERGDRRADGLELRIAGEGPQRDELQHLAQSLGVGDRTRFPGRIDHAEVPAFLQELDVFVALSRSESFGVAVLEASACELPVLVSDAGGLPEVVLDNETGRVVPGDDERAAIENLEDLVSDADQRQRFGREGRRFVQARYEWSDTVRTMEDAYRELLADTSGRE